MAKRYSGDLQINVTYDDHNFYRASVSSGGKVLWRGRVKPDPAGVGPGVGYDSPKAYDEIASSALAFADDEVGGIGDEAEFKEDMTGYLIRRKPHAGKGAIPLPRGTSHATKASIHHGAIKRNVGDDWMRRSRGAAARGEPVVGPWSVSRQRPTIVVRKLGSRWQPINSAGQIVRGTVYNANGAGYGTRQAAAEAAEMFRKLGKQA